MSNNRETYRQEADLKKAICKIFNTADVKVETDNEGYYTVVELRKTYFFRFYKNWDGYYVEEMQKENKYVGVDWTDDLKNCVLLLLNRLSNRIIERELNLVNYAKVEATKDNVS